MTEPARTHAPRPRTEPAVTRSSQHVAPKPAGRRGSRQPGAATRAAGPKPAGAPAGGEGTRSDVIRLSLGSARRELERAARELGEQETVDKARATIVIANAAMVASQHLIEASRAFAGAGEELITTTLHDDIEATSRALAELTGLVRERASAGATAALEPVIGEEQQLRRHLGLRPTPGSAVVTQADKGGIAKRGEDRADDTRAIGPALDLARLEAETAFAQLVKRSDDRGQILPTATRTITQHLEYASWLLARAGSRQDVSVYTPRIAAVSTPILRMRAWLALRQANAALMAEFSQVIRAIDSLRAAAGLDALTSVDTPALPQSESEEIAGEQDEIRLQLEMFGNAVTTQFEGFKKGADQFLEFAKLERPVPSSFWEGIAGEILIVLIGNLAAPGLGFLASALAAKGGLLKGIVDYAAGAAVDSTQVGLQGALAAAKASSPNQLARERQFFANGIVLAQARLVQHTNDRVATLVKEKRVSSAEIEAMRTTLNEIDLSNFATGVYQQTVHAYALLQARKGLGAPTDPNGPAAASPMGDYFDIKAGGGLKKLGTTGVGRLSLGITQPADELRVRVDKFEVQGMNDDMAIAVLENAGYRLGRLALPVEIAFIPPRWGRRFGMSETIVAVDERGSVRASFGWEGIEEIMRSQEEWRTRPTNAALLDSPQALVDAMRDVVLPRSAARITEGG